MNSRMPGGRAPILVAGGNADTGEAIVGDLRRLERVAVWVDTPDAAVDMMNAVEFAIVIVNVDEEADWDACRRIAAAAGRPVAVVTEMISPDRRYRDAAFQAGIAAYVRRPYATPQLGEVLRRVEAGATCVELVENGGCGER